MQAARSHFGEAGFFHRPKVAAPTRAPAQGAAGKSRAALSRISGGACRKGGFVPEHGAPG